MLEAGTMLLFCAVLFASVALGWSIIPALFVGVLLFMGYGLVRRCSLRAMASRAAGSVRSAGTVVVAFVLIGVLTSLWRASGTIAFIVAHSTAVIHAATVIPLSFLLCSAMSVLVGSSFASAATMGTICMSLGLSMQANPVMLGGAILAGVYVGDRCSPVSTSALLVKQLTHTNLFNTIARMLRTGAVPFVLSCVVYVAAAVVEWLCASGGSGFGAASAAATAGSAGSARAAVSTNASSITDIGGLFSSAFDLHWLTLVPALLVIVLALLRVDVRLLMLASIAASVAVCVGVQHMEWAELLRLLIFGYHAQNPQVAALLDGGGILSMLTVMATVCISSAYAGIFAETRMLARLQQVIEMLGHRIGACGATMITATCAAALACNQTLTIMLTHQLCGGLYGDDESERSAQAIDLEDSAVVIAPLIPWSIAGAVPLATINAPTLSLAAATCCRSRGCSPRLYAAARDFGLGIDPKIKTRDSPSHTGPNPCSTCSLMVSILSRAIERTRQSGRELFAEFREELTAGEDEQAEQHQQGDQPADHHQYIPRSPAERNERQRHQTSDDVERQILGVLVNGLGPQHDKQHHVKDQRNQTRDRYDEHGDDMIHRRHKPDQRNRQHDIEISKHEAKRPRHVQNRTIDEQHADDQRGRRCTGNRYRPRKQIAEEAMQQQNRAGYKRDDFHRQTPRTQIDLLCGECGGGGLAAQFVLAERATGHIAGEIDGAGIAMLHADAPFSTCTPAMFIRPLMPCAARIRHRFLMTFRSW